MTTTGNTDAGRSRRSTAEIKQGIARGETLVYPENLVGSAEQGHYVQFFINEQIPASLSTQGNNGSISEQAASLEVNLTSEDASGENRLRRNATRTLKESICLYMPATVEVSYGSNYTDSEIGSVALAGVAAYDQFVSTQGTLESLSAAGKAAAGVLSEDFARKGLGFLEEIGLSGAKSVVELRSGLVVNNRMEMIFENVSRREFSYTFKFMPRSQKEATTVAEIIKTFKIHMLPELTGKTGVSRTYIVPSTFNIHYMYISEENKYLNKIGTSVLSSMDVKYGGERYQTFRAQDGNSGPPVESEVTLKFQELQTITRAQAEAGF